MDEPQENREKEFASYELDAHGLKVKIRIVDKGSFVPVYEITVPGLGDATKVLLISLRQELLSMVPIDPTRIEDKEYIDELTAKYIEASNIMIDRYLPGSSAETKRVLIAYIVNFMLDKTVPKSCMASGGIYRWTDKTDDREVPDTLSAIYEYDSKFHINYSCYFGNDHFGYGEQVFGNEGTIEVMNRDTLTFTPETYRGRAPENIKSRKTLVLGRKDVNQLDDGVFAHFRNFILSVQGKEQPIAPPPIGQQAAISGHMATLAYKNQKKAIWDEAAQRVRFS